MQKRRYPLSLWKTCLATLGVLALTTASYTANNTTRRPLEKLDRGLVAVRKADGSVFVSWRLLNSDPKDLTFNLYRSSGNSKPAKVNPSPLTEGTCFTDTGAGTGQVVYTVRPVVGDKEQRASKAFTVSSGQSVPYLSLPLQTPDGYSPNDVSVGDLDGDGQYEIVIHQTKGGKDNSQAGVTGEPILEAYTLQGKLLWRINLGKNIREGAHYTQFMVYDLDGDGRAEVACKTADGTVDGTGKVIGDPKADYRNASGYVLSGPEFLTIFDGKTGKALATTDYVPGRGNVGDWGDNYGNRCDRFLACVAYLDGQRPSLVMCRGYYTRTVLAAWNWRGGKLTPVWTFDSNTPGNERYAGQGNHGLSVGDVDDDGRDEVVYGAMCVDDNGKGLYTTGLGHGDALHLSDLDPNRPGLEVWDIHEKPRHDRGVEFRDARTGAILWSKPSPDVGRGVALDIDPRYPGYEMWASGAGLSGVWNVKGETISEAKPRSCNFGIWWDGDLLREILDGVTITKWDWENSTEIPVLDGKDWNCASNNGTKANPALSADILGDWREELIARTADNKELRIFTTTIPTQHRMVTLMHDPQYRLAIAWQNVGYNQPPHPGFFLGVSDTEASRP
ncbi:MAG: rhamnogalacturonan lyase [Armatimonadaceae bacterium]